MSISTVKYFKKDVLSLLLLYILYLSSGCSLKVSCPKPSVLFLWDRDPKDRGEVIQGPDRSSPVE